MCPKFEDENLSKKFLDEMEFYNIDPRNRFRHLLELHVPTVDDYFASVLAIFSERVFPFLKKMEC
jgi:hypothetical protein